MLDQYINRVRSLSPREAGMVASELYRRRVFPEGLCVEVGKPLEVENLVGVLSGCKILAADVVAALLPVPGPVAQNALEKLLGRPINHLPPQAAPPPPPKHEGAKPVVQDVGPTGRRTIHRIAPNPKRAGTGAHARYALYHEGQTVAEYLAAGGAIRDVSWDVRQKFIELRDPGPKSMRVASPSQPADVVPSPESSEAA